MSFTIPKIEKITLTTANAEYSFEMPKNVLKYQFQARSTIVDLLYAFETGQVDDVPNGLYWSLGQGKVEKADNVNTAKGLTLYFASSTAGAIVELIYWTGTIRRS